MDLPYNVLFISQRNSARSLMAEAVVNRHGQGRFRAFSAATDPVAEPNPLTLEVLKQDGYDTHGSPPCSICT